ncbi:MAG: DUF3147 family protein [Verrucomicrobiota bacterium]
MLAVVKIFLNAGIIFAVSEIAKSNNKVAALIAALPLVTTLVMIWMFVEKTDPAKIADHAYYTFWYVLPTLPMFLLIPLMMKRGVAFPLALGAGILLTAMLYWLTVSGMRKFGVDLDPNL